MGKRKLVLEEGGYMGVVRTRFFSEEEISTMSPYGLLIMVLNGVPHW